MRVLKKCCMFVLCVGIVVSFIPKSYADATSEAILKLLIKKGVITEGEVDSIKAEVTKQETQAPATLEERVTKLEKKVPAWIENFKLKSDLRLRNEYIANDEGQDNNRQRIRFRLGGITKANDLVKMGFGLATGSSDSPTSTNQSLESEFQSKSIWLDYAYVKYEPYKWLTLTGGQFDNPFFSTDMLWDSDIRFDGFIGQISKQYNKEGDIPTKVFVTLGYFPIDDANTSEGDDIYLLASQIGTESQLKDGYANLKTGLSYYGFSNFEGATAASLAEERGTNTYVGTYASGSTTATVANDFNVLSPIVELSFKDFFGLIDVGWGIIGEYAHNFDPKDDNNAWRTGLWLGKSKVKKVNDWKLIGQYSRLERDVFYDGFTDADFNSAGTDAKGWELIFDYGIADNVILSFDYYNTESLSNASEDQQIVQADVIFKF